MRTEVHLLRESVWQQQTVPASDITTFRNDDIETDGTHRDAYRKAYYDKHKHFPPADKVELLPNLKVTAKQLVIIFVDDNDFPIGSPGLPFDA